MEERFSFLNICDVIFFFSFISRTKHKNVSLPAPGVMSITGEWAELVIGESVVKVTVVGVVEH